MVPDLEQVVARYDEPHRRYHDRRHLDHVLEVVEGLLRAVAVPDPRAVRLAALFHDAVYDPRSDGNEAASADLAGQVLGPVEHPTRVAAVQRLVLATTDHQASAPDEAVLIDADLAVLAAPRARYVASVRDVRREYGHLSDEAWRGGRAAVLRGFLVRPRIFTSPPMQEQERQARVNLAAELASLG